MGGDWRRGALAVALALLIAVSATACSDRRSASPDPTLPRRTTTTDPFAVPDPIDVAYVERVMEALNSRYGDAARLAARDRRLSPEFTELMHSVYATEEALDVALQIWRDEEAAGFVHIRSEPGDPRTLVTRLLHAEPVCIVAGVQRDRRPLLVGDPPPEEVFAVLVRAPRNPTGWALALDGFLADGSTPSEAQCAAE